MHPAHARSRLRRRRKCTKNTADGFYFAFSRRVLSRKICAHLLHTLFFPCFTQCTLFLSSFQLSFSCGGGRRRRRHVTGVTPCGLAFATAHNDVFFFSKGKTQCAAVATTDSTLTHLDFPSSFLLTSLSPPPFFGWIRLKRDRAFYSRLIMWGGKRPTPPFPPLA